jgi:hypothetical protein
VFTRTRSPVPILSHKNPLQILNLISQLSILILSSHLPLDLSDGLFHSIFPTKLCMHSSSLPCVLHITPISSFLIRSP